MELIQFSSLYLRAISIWQCFEMVQPFNINRPGGLSCSFVLLSFRFLDRLIENICNYPHIPLVDIIPIDSLHIAVNLMV